LWLRSQPLLWHQTGNSDDDATHILTYHSPMNSIPCPRKEHQAHFTFLSNGGQSRACSITNSISIQWPNSTHNLPHHAALPSLADNNNIITKLADDGLVRCATWLPS